MKNIIVMASYAGSGKDTVADKLIEDSKEELHKMALGYGIHSLYNHFSSIGSQQNKIRESLQKTGESLRDIYGKDIWIRDLEYRKTHEHYSNIVIPDVRKLYEFSYFCFEKDFLPLYIKVDRSVAFKRLNKRDQEVDEEALGATIEHQMNFIEDLPSVSIGESGLKKVSLRHQSILNNIYIVNNNYGIERLNKQLEDWEELNWPIRTL